MGTDRPLQLAVVGAGDVSPAEVEVAHRVGVAIAERGAVLVCGGLGGVMAAACRGARDAGGRTVGIIPGQDPRHANPWVETVIVSGLGHARNVLVVQSADAVVALPGSHGTRSEISIALKVGRPVIGVAAWCEFTEVVAVVDPVEAVARAVHLAARWRARVASDGPVQG